MKLGKSYSDKVFILGVDGLDPRYANKMLREGKMPNLQKYIDAGSCREDLVMLGGHPTVTPPMWTTLACGCYANVHGITGFNRKGSDIDKQTYNCDSRNCKAEPLWNITAKAGMKTCVFHWPANSWPPTCESENLFVIDGSTPGPMGMAACLLAQEFMVVADTSVEAVTFLPSATADISRACIIKKEDLKAPGMDLIGAVKGEGETSDIKINEDDPMGMSGACHDDRLSIAVSPVKVPSNWQYDIPEGAREFTLVLSKGLIRRPGLILKNENGEYDKVVLYKNKKSAQPFVTLPHDVMVDQIYDQAVVNDEYKDASYSMKLLNISPDGSHVDIYISNGMDMHCDSVFYPKSLFYELTENVGHIAPGGIIGNHDPEIVTRCMLATWDSNAKWQSDALHYMINEKDVQVIFSHFHNIDIQEHRFIRYMSEGTKNYREKYGAGPVERYQKFMDDVYIQCDNYLGSFLHLLDEDWTIIITSDHAQVCPPNQPVLLGDSCVNVGVMSELGFTTLKKDENGNPLREIDWDKTVAVANRECNIHINLKGRDPHGIVDPKDKYELEEEIMTALYGYRHPVTGKRVVALALRNKDAVLLGYGGPECGDICYWIAEGYNVDHADGLSTTYGDCETSLSPIFIAAGKGIKKNFKTDRWIREVDVAPTMAVLLGTDIPAQCEGAPVYQIFDEA